MIPLRNKSGMIKNVRYDEDVFYATLGNRAKWGTVTADDVGLAFWNSSAEFQRHVSGFTEEQRPGAVDTVLTAIIPQFLPLLPAHGLQIVREVCHA